MNTDVEILKADVKGRVRMSLQGREAILNEFEKSGASGAAFAKIIGINYQTFAGWVRRRRKGALRPDDLRASRKSPVLNFAEAIVVGQVCEKTALTLELPGGARLKLSGLEQVELVCLLLARLDRKEARPC